MEQPRAESLPVTTQGHSLTPQTRFDLARHFLSDFDTALQAFLAFQDVADNSKDTYRRDLRQFKAWLDQKGITLPGRLDILAYKDFLRANVKPLTMSGYIAAVRKFFQWTETIRQYPNIAIYIKGAKRGRQDEFEKDVLTKSQTLELLEYMSTRIRKAKGQRDFAIVSLMIGTAIRTIGLVRADVGDLSQKGAEATLRVQGKGRDRKDRKLYLTHRTLKPILGYLQMRRKEGQVDDGDPLFVSHGNRNLRGRLATHTVSKMVKRNFKSIGLDSPRLTAHSLRHSAITFALLGGASIQETKMLARHASLDTTLIYAHNLDTEANPPGRYIDSYLETPE